MKWFLCFITIWSDGSYTFLPPTNLSPQYAFDTEQACRETIKPEPPYTYFGQPTAYRSAICLQPDVINNYIVRWTLHHGTQ
jgi:hypothetical protein